MPPVLCGHVSPTNQLAAAEPMLGITMQVMTYVVLFRGLVVLIWPCQKLLPEACSRICGNLPSGCILAQEFATIYRAVRRAGRLSQIPEHQVP